MGSFDQARAEAAVRELLLAVGEDPDREGLRETPARVARAYAEIFAGLHSDPTEVLNKTFNEDHRELVLVKDIPIYSTCEHHLVPFFGKAHIGYIPGASGKVTGLSKLARLVDLFAKRPQVQERLTSQVADAGVSMINDVSGGAADPRMLKVMAESQIPVCLMHWQTDRFGDAAGAHHGVHVVEEVTAKLHSLIDSALEAGVNPSQICLDPGLGFAKTAANNWALLHGLDRLADIGFPLLVGASRKRFLAELGPHVDIATAAVTAIVAAQGVWGVRVHDVVSSRSAVDVAARIRRGE